MKCVPTSTNMTRYVDNDNDDKTVNVENIIKSENATENNVEVDSCVKRPNES